MASSSFVKIETDAGFPCYIYDKNRQQWDHPNFPDIINSLRKYRMIRFSSYRMALKIRALQKELNTYLVPIHLVSIIFERHRLSTTENALNLEPFELEAILTDIFFATNKTRNCNIDIDLSVELCMNLLYNIFDPNREGKLQVLSAKIIFSVLSQATFEDLCRYLFYHCSDHNQSVSRRRLQSLLTPLAKLGDFIGEEMWFGSSLVQAVVTDCFIMCPGPLGLTQPAFNEWFSSEPTWLAWISVLQRIILAEHLAHPVSCTYCNVSPLKGLRFKCVRCKDYNLCLNCFGRGLRSRNHKSTHGMQEISSFMTNPDSTTFYSKFRRMFNNLRCTQDTFSDSLSTNTITNLSTSNTVVTITTPILERFDENESELIYSSKLVSNSENVNSIGETNVDDLNTIVETDKLGSNDNSQGTVIVAEIHEHSRDISKNATDDTNNNTNGLQKKKPLSFRKTICINQINLDNKVKDVIDKLEIENKKLLKLQLESALDSDLLEFFQHHRNMLDTQIENLKFIKIQLQQSKTLQGPVIISTPLANQNNTIKNRRTLTPFNFSPISVKKSEIDNNCSEVPSMNTFTFKDDTEQSTQYMNVDSYVNKFCNSNTELKNILSKQKNFVCNNISEYSEWSSWSGDSVEDSYVSNNVKSKNASEHLDKLVDKLQVLLNDSMSYDNTQLSATAQELENMLDSLIDKLEEKRAGDSKK